MRKFLSVVVCMLAVGVVQAADVYHLVKEIPIGGEGGWDYLIVDAASHRLYTSHATKIVVADTETGTVVGEIPDLPACTGLRSHRNSGAGSPATAARTPRRSSI